MTIKTKKTVKFTEEPIEYTKKEIGALEGDQPYYMDYGYSRKEWAIKLSVDRLTNEAWKASGYCLNLDD